MPGCTTLLFRNLFATTCFIITRVKSVLCVVCSWYLFTYMFGGLPVVIWPSHILLRQDYERFNLVHTCVPKILALSY